MPGKSPAVFLFALLLGLVASPGADLYLTPEGAGKKDGSSLGDAFPGAALSTAINERMQPGDRLLVAAGVYPDVSCKLVKGGTAGHPKTIVGVEKAGAWPVFTSTWSIDRPDKGATFLEIGPGVSYVTLQHLRIRSYCFGVRAATAPGAPRSHLLFNDVDIEQQRHGFYLSDCEDLRLENCDLKRYSKHGFRFDQGCTRVSLRKCTADCSEGDADWETKTELFPFGFTINDGGTPNSAFVFEDCVARHNRKSNQTIRYTNGDGFVVEGNTRDVSFLRCRSFQNQDGGFDLKVPDVHLKGCVASGQRRNFRIWAAGTLTNCFGGWSTAGLWCKNGGVTVDHCTFLDNKQAVDLDGKATMPVTLTDCLLSPAGKESNPLLQLKDTVSMAAQAAAFPRADAQWDGLGPALDSGAAPAKGYRSTRP